MSKISKKEITQERINMGVKISKNESLNLMEQEKIDTQTLESRIQELENSNSELNEKYLRLYADYDNYKKRSLKEKEDIKSKTKIEVLSSILELDNDLSIAVKNEKSEGIKILLSKVSSFLNSHGIEEVDCDEYNSDIHEVISILSDGSKNIIDVVSKGYRMNGSIIKYPKVILGDL